MDDTYKTITASGEGLYKEKMSKFLSFAEPCRTPQEALEIVKMYRNEYCDARHCCWAYMLGPERKDYRSNDDGEPSGTAGKPILGQINSFGLTNVVIIVVRYFGGIKLGTSGLIVAYREAARLAIEEAEILECHEQATVTFTFPYLSMNDVMKLVKGGDVKVVDQQFDNTCSMTLQCDADKMPALRTRIDDIDGTTFDD